MPAGHSSQTLPIGASFVPSQLLPGFGEPWRRENRQAIRAQSSFVWPFIQLRYLVMTFIIFLFYYTSYLVSTSLLMWVALYEVPLLLRTQIHTYTTKSASEKLRPPPRTSPSKIFPQPALALESPYRSYPPTSNDRCLHNGEER